MNLDQFLEHKPLFYEVIDHKRMPHTYASIQEHFKLPRVIHIVGTNGKGTTGRFLAHMLRAQGLHVGHYTSPHIIKFNERIWIDDNDVNGETLEMYHQKLIGILPKEEAAALSYFEYTTLLAMLIFGDKCDYVVLEAGMGGEFDATNVFLKILSIVTPIGIDHQAFLGEHIEAIAQTKINSITTDFVLAKQYAREVNAIALKKSLEIEKKCFDVNLFFDEETQRKIDSFVAKSGYSSFLGDNFTTAFCALRHLGYDIDFNTFKPSLLKGRCQKIYPNVTIDVGHNVMAAQAIVKNFGEKKVVLVYNSYKDKDYQAILEILKPVILEIQVIDIQSQRAVEKEALFQIANTLGLSISSFETIQKENEYLVFGSFSVAEAFLKGMNEK